MTPVLFRVDKRPECREVVAILPTLPANPGNFVCYAHMGQHGECSTAWLASCTRPASDKESADLARELKQVGYDDLKVVRRITRAMRNQAWKE